jgi:SAM-dependent methyltransferase
MPDISKEKFIEFWGQGGYQQTFDAGYDCAPEVEAVLEEYAYVDRALEIGCGNGFWTRQWLLPRFKEIVTVDVIERPAAFDGIESIRHICLPSADYSLPGVEDCSIDFVWSFGTFCHFTNKAISEYLESVYRVLREGAYACIMFADWQKHPDFKDKTAVYGEDPEEFCGWTCSNLESVMLQIRAAGLTFIKDAIPEFRDTLAIMRKP